MKTQEIKITGRNASGDIKEEVFELTRYNWLERLIRWFKRKKWPVITKIEIVNGK